MTRAHPTLLPWRLVALSLLAGRLVEAQEPLPEDRGAAGLWQALQKLQTTVSVLHITAHPDDEDAALLTTLARQHGFRTMLLSLTRGEGGANLISSDFFDALGVLRTLEHREADRRYGVEQFYTRAVDYGFSKTLEEALKSWGGEEKVLEDVVRVVRRERPDIIVARFRGDPRDGHGHHMFSGVMAQRAYKAAADPSRFPEQIKEGLRPWKAQALFLPQSRSEPVDGEVKTISTGDYDVFLGQSYAQLARIGYSFHRSQGMSGGPVLGGPQETRYLRIAGSAGTGFDLSDRLEGAQYGPEWFQVRGDLEDVLRRVVNATFQALRSFDYREPEKMLEPLTAGLRAAREAMETIAKGAPDEQLLFLLRRKEQQFQDAIALALGLEFTAITDTGRRPPWVRDAGPAPAAPFRDATPGETFPVRVRIHNRSSATVNPGAFALELPPGWSAAQDTSAQDPAELHPITYNQSATTRFNVTVAADARPTRPHWHRDSIAETFYTIDSSEHATLPLPPPPVLARARFDVLGTPVELRVPVQNSVEDPVLGNRLLPLSVVPAIGVQIRGEHGIVRLGQTSYRVSMTLHSSAKSPVKGTLRLQLPEGWRSAPESIDFALEKEGEESAHEIAVSFPGDLAEKAYTVEAVARVGDREYREGWRTITARDIGRAHFFRPARHTVRGVDVKVTAGRRVGYVMGSGDEVPQGLEMLGAAPVLLSAEDVAGSDLSNYGSIWIGVRAYAVRPELKTHHRRLMDYVERGGVLIVQYQTPEYEGNFAPYPYSMTDNPEEVSEQDSPVVILAPENVLFAAPNRITPGDFDGWVEQRGSKFWKTWDARYTPLLETHDTGQEPQKGGFLFARHGRGAFVYCAYAWYRQLPAAVPGAYRIVGNLLSLRSSLGASQ